MTSTHVKNDNQHYPPPHSEHLIHPKYRPDIDGLRAIAILSVVGFHAFPDLVHGGFIGVDIFFVISGYLISTIIIGSLERGSFSFVEFYSRRIKRIFPALLLVLIACFVFGWFTLLAEEYKLLGKHIAGGAGFVSNFIFWDERGYFVSAAETKPLLHLWSLGIEEQFYIVWPFLLWLAWKLKIKLLTITIIVGVISFALNIGEVNGGHVVAAFYSPQTRFWELLMGSVLAYMALHRQQIFPKYRHRLDEWLSKIVYEHAPETNGKLLRNVQSMFGGVLIAIGVLVITKERYFPGWWAVLPTLGVVLIISAGAQAWFNRVALSNRVLVWFGLISYPLYLWHWPLLSFARIVESEMPTLEVRISAVLISILLAWLTFRLIEKPIRFGERSRAKTVMLLALMVVVGYMGYNSYKRDGLGFRLPKILQEFTQYQHDFSTDFRQGTCFLNPEQDTSAFNACTSQPEEDKKPSILLWGDSHAAHLYVGYKASFGEKYKIIQRTAGGCLPVLNYDGSPHCKEIYKHVIELIKHEKPGKVVLAGLWTNPNLADKTYGDNWKKIEETIAQLRKIGITDIDLIGPVPQWIDSLPKQLWLKYRSDKSHRIPERMQFGLNQNAVQLEPLISDLASRLKVNYISPIKILCNERGCITRIGETGDTLTSFDYGHLTKSSSRFLVSQFPIN